MELHTNPILDAFLHDDNQKIVEQTQHAAANINHSKHLEHLCQACRYAYKNNSLRLLQLIKSSIPLQVRAHPEVQVQFYSHQPLEAYAKEFQDFFASEEVKQRYEMIKGTESLLSSRALERQDWKAFKVAVDQVVDPEYNRQKLLFAIVTSGWPVAMEYAITHFKMTDDNRQLLSAAVEAASSNKIRSVLANLQFERLTDEVSPHGRFAPLPIKTRIKSEKTAVDLWTVIGMCEALSSTPIGYPETPEGRVLQQWGAVRQRDLLNSAVENSNTSTRVTRKI